MSIHPETEEKIKATAGVFTIGFLIAACFYPWQALLACILMLAFVGWLLATFGSQHRGR